MKDADSSLATARTLMLPSRFFCPATPVTLDDPSSIATINSFDIFLSFIIFLLTDNLVIELQRDAAIAIPASMAEAVFIELAKTFKFARYVARGTKIDHVVADTRNQFKCAIRQDIELHHLIAPEPVLLNKSADRHQVTAGIGLCDMPGSHEDIQSTVRKRQHLAISIHIILLPSTAKNTDSRPALRKFDIHMTIL